jgi:glutamyl-tRNA reductase
MMSEILVIGLNHVTAPVEIRERITFPGDETGQVTRSLLGVEGIQEAVIVSTCNRSEVIVAADNAENTTEGLISFVAGIHGLDAEPLKTFLYLKKGAEAVRHVFRVASSLDSMVIGEPQILGQVKEGYSRAANAGTTGPMLNRLMHRAFFSAKRVRTETGIGLAAVSVAYVAVELARKILGELHEKSVMIIGAGEMAELAARHLADHAQQSITVFNRTYENACSLARRLGGLAAPMEKLNVGLAEADVVITSTGSCEPLITEDQMKGVMRRRRFRPIFLIDIAIPRDVEPSVNDIDGVYLYNIDDLQTVVQENLGERRLEAQKGEAIVEDEVEKFMKWTKTLHFTPTIVALKEKLESIRSGELARLNGKLAALSADEREIVELITRSIINKIAHDPISFLKKTGLTSKQNMYLDVTQRLFNLDASGNDRNNPEKEPIET